MPARLQHWPAAVAIPGLLAASLCAVAAPPARAATAIAQSGAFEVGNLLDYANSDFEGTVGNWRAVSNAKLSDDTGQAFLHNDSLLDAAVAKGTSSFELGTGPAAVQIKLTGAKYRVGAYFKMPLVNGQTVRFSLGCYSRSGVRWVSGAASKLAKTTRWQYSEDDISVPPGCALVQSSPKVTLGGLPARAAVTMDEVIFAPYRAALTIGAHGTFGADGKGRYDAEDWILANKKIGPLQSDKEFWQPTQQLPGNWDNSKNNCYGIERILGASDSVEWPACVISYSHDETESQLKAFFTPLPSRQMVIMVYHNEVEDRWKSLPGPQFVKLFETQSRNIRRAAAAAGVKANVFVAEDSADSQYGTTSQDDHGDPRPGDCPYIVPASSTDFYLVDHYDNNVTGQGPSLPDETGQHAVQWTGWLSCVRGTSKPVGLGEYGFNCKNGSPNDPAVSAAITNDHDYLAAILRAAAPANATQPVIMWEYWYGANPGKNQGGCVFSNPNTIRAWTSSEKQNGGG